MVKLSDADTLEILIKGTLVVIGGVLLIVVSIPLVFLWILWQLAKRIFAFLLPFLQKEPVYQPTRADLRGMAEKIERENIQAKVEESKPQPEDVTPIMEPEEPEDEPEIREPKELVFHKNFYLESRLGYGQKEALFAQGYKKLKVSPYGDSGASYYWVKTRYNESKEHAFFCYLIEKELRKHTKEVELFVNSGPDVITRYAGNVYAFDVETGKNLIRKPEQTKNKFAGYKEDYYRSYIFVTSKMLKRKYHRMGIVITRSTFRKIIADIFS